MNNTHKKYADRFESAGWTVLEYDRTGFFLEADQIKGYVVVIDNGEIVETGTHNELIQKQGKYYELYTGI